MKKSISMFVTKNSSLYQNYGLISYAPHSIDIEIEDCQDPSLQKEREREREKKKLYDAIKWKMQIDRAF